MPAPIHIIGGGLAGSEAAWQIAEAGLTAVLHEMRPVRPTAAHQTDRLAELVCSNSLKSEQEDSAPWLLKRELRRLGSLVLQAAAQARVPGGHALTVDRDVFSAEVTRAIAAHPRIEIRREEVREVPDTGIAAIPGIIIIATGPLFFYDSISPIVEADSVDQSIAFRASRYGKSLDGTADYLNCPFDRPQYEVFRS